MEDEASLPVGSARRRKRLHSAGRHDFEGTPSTGDPGQYRGEGEEEELRQEEEELRWCRRCHIMAAHLERQAAVLKDSADPTILLEELSLGSASADARCGLCGSSHQQLRRGALQRVLGITVVTRPGPAGPPDPLPSSTSRSGELPPKQQKCTNLGGGGTKDLATVTPLPPMAGKYLEGLWKVTSLGSAVQDVPVKPAAHSITTATRRPQTTAGTFFLRTAQKLSLSCRNSFQPEPPSPASEVLESPPPDSEAPGPPLFYTGGSSGAQLVSLPTSSPNFLKVGSKVKDVPRKGISGSSGGPRLVVPKSIPGPPDHTVIYVGPGGKEVLDQELSDHGGLPSSLPIVPSLNKKLVKDTRRRDGDHLKCSTFAELQERLEGIGDGKGVVPPQEGTASSRTSWQKSSERTTKTQPRPSDEERSRYHAEVDRYHAEVGGYHAEVGGYQAEMGWNHPEVGRLHAEVGGYQAGVGGYHAEVGGYHAEVGGSDAEVGGYHAEAGGYHAEVGGYHAEVGGYQGEEGGYQGEAYGYHAEAGGYHAEVGGYQGEVGGYHAEVGGYQAEVGGYQGEVGGYQAEVGGYQAGVSGYQGEVGVYQGDVGGYRAALLGRSVDGGFMSATMALQREVGLNWEDELVFTVIEEIPHGFVLGNGRPSHRLGTDRPLQPEPIRIIGSMNDEYDVWTPHQGRVAPPDSFGCGTTPSVISWPCDVNTESTPNGSSVSRPSIYSNPTTALLKGLPEMRAPRVPDPCHTAHSSLPRKSPSPPSGAGQRDNIRLHLDPLEVLSSGTSRSEVSTQRFGGNNDCIPRTPKAHLQAQSVPGVGEESSSRRGENPFKLPRLIRVSMTQGSISKPQSSEAIGDQDAVATQRSSAKGRPRGPKTNLVSRFWSGLICSPTPATRHSGQDPKKRTVASPRALNRGKDKGKFPQTSEEEFTTAIRRLKIDRGSPRTSFSPKKPRTTADSRQKYGSLASGGSVGSTTAGSVIVNDVAASGGNSRSNRTKLGELVSLVTTSQPTPTSSDERPRRGSGGSGQKVRALLSCSSRNPSTPSKQEGRGTVMGTKQVLIQAASSRVSKLAAGSPKSHMAPQPISGRSLTGVSSLSTTLPSPYSKMTEPRKARRQSGEVLPIMGRTALRYHSGGSSGYESTILDSETAGSSASSAPDSTSESGVSSINKTRISRSPKKRGSGSGRRRLLPAPLLDTCFLGRRAGLQEPVKIKVYQIEEDPVLLRDPVLRNLQRQRNLVQDLRRKNQELEEELQEAQSRLCPHNRRRRSYHVHVDPDLDPDSQDYLQLLVQVRGDLEDRLLLSKSRLLMETCFDVCGSINRPQEGPGIEPGPRGRAGP